MRKYIMSDIHGFGNVYYAMMGYLDNINKTEDIELYINGDLIDRGYESAEILLDIKKRIEENKYKIVYLGGNHELMMHGVFEKRKKGIFVPPYDAWYFNGGLTTDDGLYEILGKQEKIMEVADFISNLKIYHKFEETINNKNIVLIHAACLTNIDDVCNLRIKDDNELVNYAVWTRKNNWYFLDLHKNRIGHKYFFTIVGHTVNYAKLGYNYNRVENYLNIDGGCGYYVTGNYDCNHFPLVEVCDGYLKILTFNCNNEIIYGNYFDGGSTSFSKNELEEVSTNLDKNVKIKKLSISGDGISGYWN